MRKLGILMLFVICSLFFVVYTVGCGQGGGGDAGTSYFPHTDGYSWAYTNQSGGSTYTSISTIEGTIAIGSITAQIWKNWSNGSTSESYLKVTDSGVYYYGASGVTTTEPLTMCSFPLTLGKTWEFYPGIVTMEVSMADFNLTVPERTYSNCYEISMTSGGGSYVSYVVLAPNAGIIKTWSVYNGTITSTQELVSKSF